METFVAVVVIFVVAVLGMAVGVIFSNRRLRGTCGGLGNMRDEQGRSICDACTTPSENCTGRPTGEAAEDDEHRPSLTSHPASEAHNTHR